MGQESCVLSFCADPVTSGPHQLRLLLLGPCGLEPVPSTSRGVVEWARPGKGVPARGARGPQREDGADSRDQTGPAAPHARPSPRGGLAQGGQRGGRASVPSPRRAFLGRRVPVSVPHVSTSRRHSEVTPRQPLRVSVSRCDFLQNAWRLADVSHFVLWPEARCLGNQRPLPLRGYRSPPSHVQQFSSAVPGLGGPQQQLHPGGRAGGDRGACPGGREVHPQGQHRGLCLEPGAWEVRSGECGPCSRAGIVLRCSGGALAPPWGRQRVVEMLLLVGRGTEGSLCGSNHCLPGGGAPGAAPGAELPAPQGWRAVPGAATRSPGAAERTPGSPGLALGLSPRR